MRNPSGSPLSEFGRNSYRDGDTVNLGIEAGCKLGVDHAMADGIINRTITSADICSSYQKG